MNQIHSRAAELNARLERENPRVATALSPLGRASYYPRDIPFQAAEAKGKEYNATIGQITDGHGTVLSVSAIKTAVQLDEAAANTGLLYSPIGGQPSLREAWNEYQTPQRLRGASMPCGPPLVTVGLTHAISLVSDLFGGPSRAVVVPDPCWGNYVQIFGIRGGAEIHRAPSYADGRFSWQGLDRTLRALPSGQAVIVVLNLPSNPGGYSPSDDEREQLVELLAESAAQRETVVLCDDAYAGLVYDESIDPTSIFWDLIGKDPGLIPIRGAGSTKEFLLFGGRVGFLTLPYEQSSTAFEVLEDKLCALIRSSVGSPVSLSQVLLEQALRSGETAHEIAEVRALLGARYRAMSRALQQAPGNGELFRVMPCNSGAFLLIELAEGMDPERIRQRLLREHDTGVVAISPRYLRLAFCSVAEPQIAELVARVVRALD